MFVFSAPVLALLANYCGPTAADRAMLVALPQLAVVPLMIRFDVWLDVRSGYLLRDSDEEATA